jgi:hypothetical protein
LRQTKDTAEKYKRCTDFPSPPTLTAVTFACYKREERREMEMLEDKEETRS